MNIEEMTANQFRASYGVPIHSLEETRETLAMQRDALRDCYGDTWRDDMAECMEEYNEEEEEADFLTDQERVNENEYRAYRRALTCELVDSLED
jgi:hypothetical protein